MKAMTHRASRRAPAVLLAAFMAAALGLAACKTPSAGGGRAASDDVTQSSPGPALQSAKPGINEPYRNPDVDTFIGRFESESREIFQQRERIVEAAGVTPGMAVADVGAGTGFFALMFAERVGPAGRVYAVDISEAFVEHIRKLAAERGLTQIETVLCPEDSVNLPPASVDLVFICDTYHHFEFPRQTMATVFAALRPGGRVVVVDFKRQPGVSRQWVLDHVRAGAGRVTAEIVGDGFEYVGLIDTPYLQENYIAVFRKPG